MDVLFGLIWWDDRVCNPKLVHQKQIVCGQGPHKIQVPESKVENTKNTFQITQIQKIQIQAFSLFEPILKGTPVPSLCKGNGQGDIHSKFPQRQCWEQNHALTSCRTNIRSLYAAANNLGRSPVANGAKGSSTRSPQPRQSRSGDIPVKTARSSALLVSPR